MSISTKGLIGRNISASDGDIGSVKDFYFDPRTWAVRFVIVDTGSWLPQRQVLIPPHAFGTLRQGGKLPRANATRNQIAQSPFLEPHTTVSRRYEEDYFRHFAWPCYWQGDGIGRTGEAPVPAPATHSLPELSSTIVGPSVEPADIHLLTTQAVSGYQLQASDGLSGHVCDFVVDRRKWTIHELVIKIGHRLSGQEVRIPAEAVTRISRDQSTIFANLTIDTIARGEKDRHPPPVNGAKERDKV